MAVKSHLICAGSELLRGKINTHASTLARRLASVGIDLVHEETVADDQDALTRAIRRAMDASPLVIVTGGLGPTFDDVSREAAAEAVGRPLTRSREILAALTAKFKRARYRAMPPMNARQADVIEGATAIDNAHGTAPGQWLSWETGKILLLLPGPPRELQPMLEKYILPRLRRAFPSRPRAECHLHFIGIAESLADQKIRPIIRRFAARKEVSVDFTILAHLGLVDLDVFVEAPSRASAAKTMATIAADIRRRLQPFCYGMNDQYPLEKVVGALLRAAKATVSVAESCSGGLLAEQLTRHPGSSNYFVGGIVAYDNTIKEEALGVSRDMLKRRGAVSPQVAQALAQGVRRKMRTTYGIGITGIAGPGGATAGKPVGLVYVGLSGPRRDLVATFNFSGDREGVRSRAVTAALDLLRQECLVKNRDFR